MSASTSASSRGAWLAAAAFAASLGAGALGAERARAERRGGPAEDHGSFVAGMSCGDCHTPDGWTLAAGGGPGGFDHARTGFPLLGRHADAACVECHAPGRAVRADCAACHQSPHQGRLSSDCASCHEPRAWSGARAVVLHARTRLPLTGAHLLADCTECHRRTGERRLTSPPPDCVACHEADVRAPGVHPDHLGRAPGLAPFPRDCSLCHRATAWSPAFVEVEVAPIHAPLAASGPLGVAPPEHELWFALRTGPHRGLDCASCHPRPAAPRDVRCTGCHAHGPASLARDHAGQAVPTAGSACLACHPGGRAR